MGEVCRFVVPGKPRGKASSRSGPGGFHYKDKVTAGEIDAIRMIARIAMAGREPFSGPVDLKLAAYIEVPKSWSKKDRALALEDKIHPTVKPDYDNLHKILDGIQPPPPPKRKQGETDISYRIRRRAWEEIKVVLLDDKQVTRWQGWKMYSEQPRLVVVITEISLPGRISSGS